MAAGVRAFIQGPPPGGGAQVETEEFPVDGQQVHRQTVAIGGRGSDDLAAVVNGNPTSLTQGLVVRQVYTDRIALAPQASSVGVASAAAVATMPTRTALSIQNTSASGQIISLGFNFPAVLGQGITLQVGDVYNMAPNEFTNDTINAISSAASGILAYQEWTT